MGKKIQRYLKEGFTVEQAVAKCHNIKHYGFLSDHMVAEHKCLDKGCPLLEKIPNRAYWYRREIKKCLRKIKKNGSGWISINGKLFPREGADIKELTKFCKQEYTKNNEDPRISVVEEKYKR